jgi:peptidoglycan/xylan/chitin deacetylase (PgdA/CDA1 family)
MHFLKSKILYIATLISILVIFIGIFVHNETSMSSRHDTQIPTSTSVISPAISGAKSKVVYLTFDADMTLFMKQKLMSGKVSSWYSRELVAYLETQKIPATIFTTGMFAEIYPDVIKGLAATPGIVIANHSYDHPGFEGPCYLLRVISTDKQKIDEMQKTQDIIKSLVGYAPTYFRHPGLCHNSHDDALAKSIGLTVEDSGLISGDAFNKNPLSIERTVLRNVHDGSVIVMHLGGPHAPATAAAIRYLVPELSKEGYTFKSL